MAIAFTQLAAATADTANATSYTGNAGTPAAGDLLLCFVAATNTVAAGSMTGTWVWTLLISFTKGAGSDTMYVFWAYASAATSTTPVFDCTGDAAAGCNIYCVRVTGADGQTQPYIRQMNSRFSATINPNVTLPNAVLTGNGVIGFVSNGTNSAVQFTAPTGWTEMCEVTYATPSTGFTVASRVSGETGTTMTWVNANTSAWGCLVMELYVAGTGVTEDGSAGTGYSGGISNI